MAFCGSLWPQIPRQAWLWETRQENTVEHNVKGPGSIRESVDRGGKAQNAEADSLNVEATGSNRHGEPVLDLVYVPTFPRLRQ